MIIIRPKDVDHALVANAKLRAEQFLFDGRGTAYNRRLLSQCTQVDVRTGSVVLFTRDTGYHSSGWWKNPDYERCYHLSLSFRDPETAELAPFNHDLAEKWVQAFFRDDRKWVWCEPPISDQQIIQELGFLPPNRSETWHYRLFCDEGWQPIKPRGEVYGLELTEAGWLSFSDLQHQRQQESDGHASA